MGRILGSPDVGPGEPFISVFPSGITNEITSEITSEITWL
jgi:hypothetical protein